MSVYTRVDEATLRGWLSNFRVGPLESHAGIAGGVENTNYFVDTAGGRYVLTLFERLSPPEAGRYLDLMAHLAAARVGCPRPVAASDGRHLSTLCGKPAALVSRLPGTSVEQATAAHCAAIGRWLAEMHRAQASFAERWPNPRGDSWRNAAAAEARSRLSADQCRLLDGALAEQVELAAADLPRGLVHADLFRDNALFADAEHAVLAGVIDFYFAGEDALLFDLAVVANDWCVDAGGETDAARGAALLAAYRERRPLTAAEDAAWLPMRRVAALRFWLSRLLDAWTPREGAMVLTKDPGEYETLLRRLGESP